MTINDLLAKWLGREGGAERANYQMFLTELTQALGLPTPDPKGMGLGDYQFEAPVKSAVVLGTKGTGRIDLYKRDCFILEAKQSQIKPGEALPEEPDAPPPEPIRDLFGTIVGHHAPAGGLRPRYDRLMADARIQAEKYALALPDDHRTPPFLIVADIGRSFELYFDWAGNGRGYGPFPDERRYRVALAELASGEPIRALGKTPAEMLRAIWTDPQGIDPRLRAAEVTRDIAQRLSRVAAQLEQTQKQLAPGEALVSMRIEATSLFLMRMLFCMFAEDVELLPKDSFKRFLSDAETRSDLFWRSGLTDLWSKMNDAQEINRFWSHGDAVVRYFNGNLFSDVQIFDLPGSFKEELRIAAGKDWRAVEPAIFGTLLEQVLTASDRSKLGAHYTPRAYVERLVQATMTDVLRAEWDAVLETARAGMEGAEPSAPLPVSRTTPAVTPASPAVTPAKAGVSSGGAIHPGNEETPAFDGVTDLRQAVGASSRQDGETDSATGADRAIALATAFHTRLTDIRVLDPACGTGNFLYVAMEQLLRLEGEVRQFAAGLGTELPPRIEPNQFLGLELNPRAAVIAELVLWIGWLRYRLANTPEAIGSPVLPPLRNINFGRHGGYDAVLAQTDTGQPDIADPRRPAWPEADFIIGNPPFIGKGSMLRERLGDTYVEALWRANPRVPKSADFVMHWWDRAADILTTPGTRLRRFGFVTTNSITQVFSRRVIERYLGTPLPEREGSEERKLHLILAIPDHPWTRVTRDAAAVRIAMTVAAPGTGEGRLVTIAGEGALDTDTPKIEEREEKGVINSDLSVGSDGTQVKPLKANEGLSNTGMLLAGQGFKIDAARAQKLIANDGASSHKIVRAYTGGGELLARPRGRSVIDFFGLSEKEARQLFPSSYDHVLRFVKPERDQNSQLSRRDKWWLFGRSNAQLRAAVAGISRFVATTETAKHRVFQFIDSATVPDHMVITIALDSAALFGILSSKIHLEWSLAMGGTLEDRPRYNKTVCFDPFPFPELTNVQYEKIADLAEELDSTRRTALAENPNLTMTGLYNLVEEVRAGVALAPQREGEVVRARARIVAKLHDDLDAAVADAYGWGEDWRRAPLPPAEIVARLVTLNADRAAEEAAGHVRWLRPDYQIPRFGGRADAGGRAPAGGVSSAQHT